MPDPWTGRGVIAVVNAKGDDIAQLATHYTAAEIGLIKVIIGMIFTAPNESFTAKSNAILNAATKLKPSPLTQKAAESLINNLVHHGWLHKSRQGNVSLATRALLELQTYLKEQYPENILKCHECAHIVTGGVACSNGDCEVRLHATCEILAVPARGQRKCPGCQTAWEPTVVGEGALRRGGGGGGANSARRPGRGDDDDEEEESESQSEDEDAEDEAADNGKTLPASGSRNRSSIRRDDDDSDDDDDDEETRRPIVKRRRAS